MKIKTPEDVAEDTRNKKDYNLYLTVKRMDYMKQRAKKAGISVSKLVDAAIEAYIAAIRTDKTSK